LFPNDGTDSGQRRTRNGQFGPLLPSLHTLAAGIDRDRDAVIAGLTLTWNSGVVEGHVNRIKMLRRQMFGRAGFTLLRKRVLLA
jgi:transposase